MSEYKERDIYDLDEVGNYYDKHVNAMTTENLRSKSAIAAELGHRDYIIDQVAGVIKIPRENNLKMC